MIHAAPPVATPVAAPATTPVYAGIVTRTLAFAIDAALINLGAIVTGAVVTLVFSVLPSSDDTTKALVLAAGGLAFATWIVAYFATFWTTTGQTPGNRVMHIRVTLEDGSPLHLRHSVARLVGIGLAALPLFAGFAPILFTDKRRGLHDYMAGTVVRTGSAPH